MAQRLALPNLRFLGWATAYWLRRTVLGHRKSFIGGMVINDKCNLQCRQCRISSRGLPDTNFDDIRRGLQGFREAGIRSVFLEGGEPFLWQDGHHNLDDIVALCRQMGFHSITIYTNGTLPIESSADTVFVSLDGLKETNDSLRGPIFDRVWDNIARSSHNNLIINYTINTLNSGDVPEFCRLVARTPRLRGIFFYFHTPYYGRDELFLDLDQRRRLAQNLLALKRKRLPVLNSVAGLKAVISNRWCRPSDHCLVWANGRTYKCCRAIGNPDVCKDCGYLGYVEILQILKLRPSAIWAGLKYIPSKRSNRG
jgi:MoaA/NifB/PqqE/SkfB family radical SAM enzyme